jgi:ribosomal protein S13
MKVAIDIVQRLLLPKLEKDASFDVNQTSIAFWGTFTTALLDFEKDAKPVYTTIYSLGLKDAEKIISKLDTVYISLIKELAENHVLGIASDAIDYLIASKNYTFEKEVKFYTDLKNAITKVERKRIKKELPTGFEKFTFEIDDTIITNVLKKKSREDLKKKMAGWDEEIIDSEEPPVNSIAPKKDTKVISLSWIKYAAAACLVLGLGVWFFRQSNKVLPEVENNVVSTDTTSVIQPKSIKAPSEVIADNTKIIEKKVQYPTDLGFTNTTSSKIIKIYLKDTSNNVSKQNYYEFDGASLIIYSKELKIKYSILSLDDKVFYLKKEADYYQLYLTKTPQQFKIVTDMTILEQLEKTRFDNEE